MNNYIVKLPTAKQKNRHYQTKVIAATVLLLALIGFLFLQYTPVLHQIGQRFDSSVQWADVQATRVGVNWNQKGCIPNKTTEPAPVVEEPVVEEPVVEEPAVEEPAPVVAEPLPATDTTDSIG